MSGKKSFEEFEVWIFARKLVKEVYIATNDLKWSKDYVLRDQIRRASISIISNIAEGSERESDKEFARFLAIAKGSTAEARAQLFIALDLDYISEETFTHLSNSFKQIEKMLGGFHKYLLKG